MCNSGAEANENAIKLASFHNKKSRLLAFNNSFHGRTSAAVAATDNKKIVAPVNAQQHVDFVALGELEKVESELLTETSILSTITILPDIKHNISQTKAQQIFINNNKLTNEGSFRDGYRVINEDKAFNEDKFVESVR